MIEPNNPHLIAVGKWHEAFGVEVNLELQESLIVEEAVEVLQAIGAGFDTPEKCAEILKEIADFSFVILGFDVMARKTDELPRFSQDSVMLVATVIKMIGVMADEVPYFEEVNDSAFIKVCESNMSKLGDDGKPLRREDGKVIKGPNYKLPDLTMEAELFFQSIQIVGMQKKANLIL